MSVFELDQFTDKQSEEHARTGVETQNTSLLHTPHWMTLDTTPVTRGGLEEPPISTSFLLALSLNFNLMFLGNFFICV